MIRISLLSFFSHVVLNALDIYCNNQKQCSAKRVFLNKYFAKFIGKLLCQSLFFHKVTAQLEKRLQQRCFSVNFVRFFRTPILYNICKQLLLVLVRIGFAWYAAKLSMFCIIVCKSVFEVLRCSFQLILHWWAPNQHTKVHNTMQVITEVYLDIWTPARGSTGI